MSIDQSRPSRSSSEASSKAAVDMGLSQFLGRLLEQLSRTSWFPAVVLVGVGAVLAQIRVNESTSIGPAIQGLTDKPLGTLIVLLFALVIGTVVTQAFEFETIQLLEGYNWARGPGRHLAAARIRRHARRQRRLEKRHHRLVVVAFAQAGETMRQRGYPPGHIEILRCEVLGLPKPSEVDQHLVDQVVSSVEWEPHLPAETLYRLEEMRARLESYPVDPSRLLPTRLGNQMRAAEDQMPQGGSGRVVGFVIRHKDLIPASMYHEYHSYRSRLDMYCSLVLVFVILAAGSVAALHGIADMLGIVATAAGLLAMAWVSYQAAVASARGLGDVLLEIAHRVHQDAEPDQPEAAQAPSPFGRLRALFHRTPV